MNNDVIKGEWNLVKGKIKEKWGQLTDDDITQINGKRDQLLGKLQKKYGYTKQNAEEELDQWETNYSSKNRIGSDLEEDDNLNDIDSEEDDELKDTELDDNRDITNIRKNK